jgi:hypothetical protein
MRSQQLSGNSIQDPAVLAGRLIAMWVHPIAAWRTCSTGGRAALLSGYFVAGYVAALVALLRF